MTTRIITFAFSVLFIVASGMLFGGELPNPTPEKLPRWRGFNLLEKFNVQWNNGRYQESDFRMIHEFGFNFVRLPMDYRCWIKDGDWKKIDENAFKDIDEAIALGNKYDIHVCVNFHRSPGYTVASPAEKTSLWTDPETLEVCSQHWAFFAKRYKGIPNSRLSFNLFNEPANVDAKTYLEIVRKIAAAIRAEDPDRLIISDGLDWGTKPLASLTELKIAQATRGYFPMQISHYKASWVGGSDNYPVPAWPMSEANGMLYGNSKKDLQAPLEIRGPFAEETSLRLHIMEVSTLARLIVEADGKTIFEKEFKPGAGEGEWKKVVHRPEYGVYQNVYDKDYASVIPAGTVKVTLRIAEGDWLCLRELGLSGKAAGGGETVLPLRNTWGEKPGTLLFADGRLRGEKLIDRGFLMRNNVAPWSELVSKGGGAMVGEFGSHNQTPHDVALAWMEDNLANWKEAELGWALWNFRGSFGIMDSDRKDVQYETYEGHKLDRKMLELLQKY